MTGPTEPASDLLSNRLRFIVIGFAWAAPLEAGPTDAGALEFRNYFRWTEFSSIVRSVGRHGLDAFYRFDVRANAGEIEGSLGRSQNVGVRALTRVLQDLLSPRIDTVVLLLRPIGAARSIHDFVFRVLSDLDLPVIAIDTERSTGDLLDHGESVFENHRVLLRELEQLVRTASARWPQLGADIPPELRSKLASCHARRSRTDGGVVVPPADEPPGGRPKVALFPVHAAFATLRTFTKDKFQAVTSALSRRTDSLQCSVFSPPAASARDRFMVQVFAHLPRHASAATRMAVQYDDLTTTRGGFDSERAIGRGTKIDFTLQIPGLVVADSVQSMIWRGRPASVQFEVRVPEHCQPGTIIGTVVVSQDGVPFGHVKFVVNVAVHTQLAERRSSDHPWKRYKYAFISYAADDRPEVLKRVQMLPKVGLEYFQDLLSLDPGERWERSLYRHIDKSDVFFLFWSRAARASEWVLREAEYALERHQGNDTAPPEIIPVPLEGPPPVLPPPSLAALHFNDTFLYFINS